MRGKCHMDSVGAFTSPIPDTATSNLLVTTRQDGHKPTTVTQEAERLLPESFRMKTLKLFLT